MHDMRRCTLSELHCTRTHTHWYSYIHCCVSWVVPVLLMSPVSCVPAIGNVAKGTKKGGGNAAKGTKKGGGNVAKGTKKGESQHWQRVAAVSHCASNRITSSVCVRMLVCLSAVPAPCKHMFAVAPCSC